MIFDILHLWIRIISDGQRGHSALEAAVRMLVAKQGYVFVTLMNVSCHFFKSRYFFIFNHPTFTAYLQAYGQCHWNQTAAFLGNDEKYRKPKPPPRPDWCFCKDKNGHKEVCDKFRNDKACIVPTYPNEFDHNSQFCG